MVVCIGIHAPTPLIKYIWIVTIVTLVNSLFCCKKTGSTSPLKSYFTKREDSRKFLAVYLSRSIYIVCTIRNTVIVLGRGFIYVKIIEWNANKSASRLYVYAPKVGSSWLWLCEHQKQYISHPSSYTFSLTSTIPIFISALRAEFWTKSDANVF